MNGIVLAWLTLFGLSLKVSADSRVRHAKPPCPETKSVQIIDVMPAFWEFWSKQPPLDQPARVRLFKETVIKPYPEVFTREVLAYDSLDNDIASFLRDVSPIIPKMRLASNNLETSLRKYVADFCITFPDFQPAIKVYLMPSLGAFDGAPRTIDGTTALLLGVDVIAQQHPVDHLGWFFDHELFHLYHRQVTGQIDAEATQRPIWWGLWEEGLATYASHVLNPDEPESRILGQPADLATRARPVLARLAVELLRNFDSVSKTEYLAFFALKNGRSDIPPRSGYYVGYLLAEDLARQSNLTDVVRLKGNSLDQRLRLALKRMTGNVHPRW